jgi:hypothetical protein
MRSPIPRRRTGPGQRARARRLETCEPTPPRRGIDPNRVARGSCDEPQAARRRQAARCDRQYGYGESVIPRTGWSRRPPSCVASKSIRCAAPSLLLGRRGDRPTPSACRAAEPGREAMRVRRHAAVEVPPTRSRWGAIPHASAPAIRIVPKRTQGGGRTGRDRPSGDRPGGCALLEEPGSQLRADQPSSDRGHRRAAGHRPRGGRAAARSPELRQRPLRAGRSRARRIHSTRLRCRRRARRTPPCDISRRRSRRPAGSRCGRPSATSRRGSAPQRRGRSRRGR